jgi:predicted TIM-barrel fold metal-dependent hydrolase
VAQVVRSRPEKYFGFAFVNAERDRGRIGELVSEAVRDFRFCGIKVHRHDARLTREICDVARRFRLPVLYDVMGEVSVTHLLATEYPSVNFIIPHLGSFADDWKAQRAFLGPLARYPNVYTDTSGVRRFELLEEAVATAGPGKILFGSDGPFLNPEVELAKVRALRLSQSAFHAVTCSNWLRITAAARHRAAELNPRILNDPARPVSQLASVT